MAITKERLAELLAAARASSAAKANMLHPILQATVPILTGADKIAAASVDTHTQDLSEGVVSRNTVGMHGEIITYNDKQFECVTLATTGASMVLLGAAGTGKSTCQRGVVSSLIASNKAGLLADDGHKYLPSGTAGIIICAFTRRAVNNIRKVMPQDMQKNCITIHKLLEYEPVYNEVTDEEGNTRNAMSFEPARNQYFPLSSSIHTIIFEESSMVSTEHFAQVVAALHHNVQFIFIGDIQQLPPVFGSAVLGYKMLELPVVELTEVYRQALESPIIRLAHRILSGKPILEEELPEWEVPHKLKLHPWKKKLSVDIGILTCAKFFSVAIDSGDYVPTQDMILIPFNKAFGADELNRHIAQHLTAISGETVHEIIAGFEKLYHAVGDKVMYEKEDAIITEIKVNGNYSGAKYQEASPLLDRWGNYRLPKDKDADKYNGEGKDAAEVEDIDAMLDAMSFDTGASDERERAGSHAVTLQLQESGEFITLTTAATLNTLSLSYAITVHKAQGSEARKVFVIFHHSHNTMLQRELLYTAVTRARESLYVICEPDSFEKGITRQKIKGNTLAEKSEYFKGKQERNEAQIRLSMLKPK